MHLIVFSIHARDAMFLSVMWTLFLPIVERAMRKSVHINNDYVDILQSVYIIPEQSKCVTVPTSASTLYLLIH